jgi:hypothetical protein
VEVAGFFPHCFEKEGGKKRVFFKLFSLSSFNSLSLSSLSPEKFKGRLRLTHGSPA